MFLINRRLLRHFEHDSVIRDPTWERMCQRWEGVYRILAKTMNCQASYDVRNFLMNLTHDTILTRNLFIELVQYYFLLRCPHTKWNIVECLYGAELCLSI